MLPSVPALETAIQSHPAATALLTAIGAVALLFLKPFIERKYKGHVAWQAIRSERSDLERHLSRNGARLDEMLELVEGGQVVPIRTHILKLGVAEKSMLFSDAAIDHLKASRITIIHKARLRLRNFNMDVAEALRALDTDELDQFEAMLLYLREANARLARWAPHMLGAAEPAEVGSLAIVTRPRRPATGPRGDKPVTPPRGPAHRAK